jgi:uncharacterized DUF497 family protein
MMTCAWDEAKSRSNFVKHGLDFADAEQVLTGPCVTFVDSRFDYGEVRGQSQPLDQTSRLKVISRGHDADYLQEKGKST